MAHLPYAHTNDRDVSSYAKSRTRSQSAGLLRLSCKKFSARSFKKLVASSLGALDKSTIAFAIVAFLTSAYATPVGVSHIDSQASYRALYANVLSTGKPSAYSTQLLERNALTERYHQEPEQAIGELFSGLGKPDERDRLFALSELSFAQAENNQARSYYLAASVFAYSFLFPENPNDGPDAYDPRLTIAVDLYNQGLDNGLAIADGREVDLTARQLALPFGALDLKVGPQGFRYGGYQLSRFVSLSDLRVRGLRNRYREAGIGAALSARVESVQDNAANQWIPPTAKAPVTAFVRMDDPRRGMREGKIHGELELLSGRRDLPAQVNLGDLRPFETQAAHQPLLVEDECINV